MRSRGTLCLPDIPDANAVEERRFSAAVGKLEASASAPAVGKVEERRFSATLEGPSDGALALFFCHIARTLEPDKIRASL